MIQALPSASSSGEYQHGPTEPVEGHSGRLWATSSPEFSDSVQSGAGFTAVFPPGRIAALTWTACTRPSCRPLLRWEQLHDRCPPLTGGRWSHSEVPGPWPLCGTCRGNWGRETTPLVFRLFKSVIQFTLNEGWDISYGHMKPLISLDHLGL